MTICDFMVLNKLESLPWDWNERMNAERQLNQEEINLLDRITELTTAADSSFSEIKSLHESNSERSFMRLIKTMKNSHHW